MPSSTDTTQYTISAFAGSETVTLNLEVAVVQGETFGDADAFALVAALQDAFPSAWGAQVQVQKSEVASTEWTTDTSSNPPSFT